MPRYPSEASGDASNRIVAERRHYRGTDRYRASTSWHSLSVVTTQDVADSLPLMTDRYPYRNLNEGVVRVNVQLAEALQPLAIRR